MGFLEIARGTRPICCVSPCCASMLYIWLLCAHRQPLADIRVGTLRFHGIGCRPHPLSLESTKNYSQSQISRLLFTSLSLQRMEMSQHGKYAAHLRELSAGRTEYHEDDGKTKRELSKNTLKNKKGKISIIR